MEKKLTKKKWINHTTKNGFKWSTKTFVNEPANSFDCDTNSDTLEPGLIVKQIPFGLTADAEKEYVSKHFKQLKLWK